MNASDATALAAVAALVTRTNDLMTERYDAMGAEDPEAWADATMVSLRGLSAQARAGAREEALCRSVEVIADRRTR